ncbi:unnamed protein product, partial [Sphagnum troendelagicum]
MAKVAKPSVAAAKANNKTNASPPGPKSSTLSLSPNLRLHIPSFLFLSCSRLS